jgi:hypothetical protein
MECTEAAWTKEKEREAEHIALFLIAWHPGRKGRQRVARSLIIALNW